MNIVVISNITLEPLFSDSLKRIFGKEGINVNVNFIAYNEALSEESSTNYIDADKIIVWLSMDCFYPNLLNDLIGGKICFETIEQDIQNKFLNIHLDIKQKTRTPVLWIGVEDYCYYSYKYAFGYALAYTYKRLIDCINLKLIQILDDNDDYVDLKTVIAQTGTENAFDNKNKYRWNAPYSRKVIEEIAHEVHKQYLIRNGITKKCLVLDCDNVLWGGILSEDGIEHIQLSSSGLGRPFHDFQRFILNLYYHGVIIELCSRNDKSEVLRMFKEHDEMLLKEEHIACFCVNWDNKTDNIQRISATLNIGLDSMVFIDDSDFEIQAVKKLLPQVVAIKYDRDLIYEQLSCFNLKSNVDVESVQQRNLTYQTNEFRRALKLKASSFDDYLISLEMKVDIHKATQADLSRIAELSQRTNKCTNGKRYTVEQLVEKLENGYMLYSVAVSDKFSSLGLVGAIGIEKNKLDLFALSCRALGRNVEEVMIDFINDKNVHQIYYELSARNHDLFVKLNKLCGLTPDS